MKLTTSLDDNIKLLKETFPIGKSYDLITRNLCLRNTRAYWIGINGFCANEILQQLISDLQNPSYNEYETVDNLLQFVASKIGYIQTETCNDWDKIVKNILSGPSALFIDGFDQAVILDTRKYPTRGIEEPDTEKVTRGSKDGFVETVVFNTALIRRRIRNPRLSFEVKAVGTETKTDVVIAYIDGTVDEQLLNTIKDKITNINVPSLTMGAKSLEELLIKKRWCNPLPQVRFTQRPDVACSFLLEGYIALIVDNSPSVMVFPCNLFQFTQNAEDYYQNPSVGTYYRFLRFACTSISLLLMPVFLLLGMYADSMPDWLQVVTSKEVKPVELFIYVIIIELGLDLFRYSSAHASSTLSNSLGLIGGLIIGDIAIELNWASKEVIFYGAVTLLTTLSISSQEFGNAIRLYRFFLVFVTGFFGIWGFGIGFLLILLSIATTPTLTGHNYMWPLIPFCWAALRTLLFRYPTAKYELKVKNNKAKD